LVEKKEEAIMLEQVQRAIENGTTSVVVSVNRGVKLTGGKSNEQQGRITKKYEMRLELGGEGKYQEKMREQDPLFQAKERKWGTRVDGTCLVEHNDQHYLEGYVQEFIGDVKYYQDGEEIEKENVVGLPTSSHNDVGLVTIRLENIEHLEED
jgi:hypothetical protein